MNVYDIYTKSVKDENLLKDDNHYSILASDMMEAMNTVLDNCGKNDVIINAGTGVKVDFVAKQLIKKLGDK